MILMSLIFLYVQEDDETHMYLIAKQNEEQTIS